MAYESWREQVEEGEQKTHKAEVGKVFLIDRGVRQPCFLWLGGPAQLCALFPSNTSHCLSDVDFVTPLCSQVVYEGLVDDIFRIKCGGS